MMRVCFCMVLCGRFFILNAREWIKVGSVKVEGVGALDASPKPWLRSLSGVPHVEFEKKEHAAIAAAWPVASDLLKRNVSAAPMYPLYLEEIHRTVIGLVSQVRALTVEVGSVKIFESQVSEVLSDLKKLSVAMSKLENLEKLPEISKNLQNIVGVLNSLSNLGADRTKSPAGYGGKEYVS